MPKNPGYIIEHCQLRCSRAAISLEPLLKQLESALDSLDLLDTHNERFASSQYHHIVKIGISGCPNGCSQPLIKDIGIIGYVKPQLTDITCRNCQACAIACREDALSITKGKLYIDSSLCLSCGDCVRACSTGANSAGENGWKLYFGGRVGRHPHFAKLADKTTDNSEIVEWIIAAIKAYMFYSLPQERLSNFLQRFEFNQSNRNALL